MRTGIWALLIVLVFPAKALACSPVVGYRVPTNIELLEQADLVVLAIVKPSPSQCEDLGSKDICFPSVVFEVQRTLKGEVTSELRALGNVESRRGETYPPFPTSLDEPNPSALWGACIRQAYSENSLVIAMFSEANGKTQQLGHPFARSIEDVEGPDALWVRAAELYLRLLSKEALRDRRQAFLRERDRLLALTTDSDAQAIAADITAFLDATQPGF